MTSLKSIFFLVEGPINSPACYRAIGISTSLVNFNVEVSIICDDRKENLSKISSLRELGVKVQTISWRPRIQGVLQCRKILNIYKPDWVVQLNPTLLSFLRLIFTNHKVIGQWDEPAILVPSGIVKKFTANFLHFWLKNRALIHISCTKAFLPYLTEAIYIPHGQYIDDDQFQGHVNVENYFAYLGNFYPLWDHKLIIESVHRASANGFRPEIIMIGSGPDLDYWKEYARKYDLKNIIFTGYLDFQEMFSLLRGASALLFPMSDTPLNQCRCSSKIFAYLAAKRPVVAHRVGEVVELIESAHFVNPGGDIINALRYADFKNVSGYKKNLKISYEYLAKVFFDSVENFKHSG